MEFSNNAEYFFGNNLRFLRKLKKQTLLSLSNTLQVSKSAISDYETGKTLPSLDVVKKFSSYFEVPIDALYNSDISEFTNNKTAGAKASKIASGHAHSDVLAHENEKYIFNLQLMKQKLESTQLQIQMLKQLLESRESENKTLRINVKLLEEQLKNYKKLIHPTQDPT